MKKTYMNPQVMVQELHTIDYLLLPTSGGRHTDEVLSRGTDPDFDDGNGAITASRSQRQNVWEDEEEEESW